MDFMRFLTIWAWVSGILASLVTLHRMYKSFSIGWKEGGKISNEQLRIRANQHGFLVPLIIAIVCWVFIIVT